MLRQERGLERVWVPVDEEDYWLGFWTRLGVPAARLADYKAWGGFFPPHPESVGDRMFYPKARKRAPSLFSR